MPVVLGQVFAESRNRGVHFGSAELLLGGDFAGGRHQQRRACEEGARALAHHDDHVAQSRHVGAACRARTVLHRDHRDARRRQPRQVAEQRAALHEAFDAIAHQVGAGALDQVDERQLVLQRHFLHPQDLVQAHRLDRAGVDARIARHHHAAHAADESDARHHAAAGHRGRRVGRIAQIARQRTQRQVGPARIQQQGDPFPRQQLPALVEYRLRFGRSGRCPRLECMQLLDARQHGLAPLLRNGTLRVPGGGVGRHGRHPFPRPERAGGLVFLTAGEGGFVFFAGAVARFAGGFSAEPALVPSWNTLGTTAR